MKKVILNFEAAVAKKNIITIMLLFLMDLSLMTACLGGNKKIIGVWEHDSGFMTMQYKFASNGKFVITMEGLGVTGEIPGEYKVVGNKIELIKEDDGDKKVLEFEINGNELTLISSEGTLKLTRQGSTSKAKSDNKSKKSKKLVASEGVKLLETILYKGVLYQKFEYDDQNRITKNTQYEQDGKTVFKTSTFKYNGNILIVSEQTESMTITKTFFREDNLIYKDGPDEYLELNSQNMLVKYTGKFSSDVYNRWETVITFDYKDGNLYKKTVEFTYGEYFEDKYKNKNYEITYTYDDKKSPLYYCKTPQWYLIMFFEWYRVGEAIGVTNNVKTVTFSTIGGEDNPKPYNIFLEYYDDGMMKSMTSDSFDSPMTFLYKTK